jgi:uncharacterized RDD family membrane protein YckC
MTGAAAPSPPEPAGLLRRLAALAYDTLLLAALAFAFTLLIVIIRSGEAIPAGSLWFEAALFALGALFYGWFWTHGGQTLGMRAWRLQVTAADGSPLDWRRALLRYAAAYVSALALGLGFLWSLFDRERRCWHDLWSGTRMVKLSARAAPPPR